MLERTNNAAVARFSDDGLKSWESVTEWTEQLALWDSMDEEFTDVRWFTNTLHPVLYREASYFANKSSLRCALITFVRHSSPAMLASQRRFSIRCRIYVEVNPFLSNLHWIEAHDCDVFIYWCRVTRGVSNPPRRSGFNPRPGHSGFSHVEIVPDDAVGQRVLSVISRFPRTFIPALLHAHLNNPHRLSRPRFRWLLPRTWQLWDSQGVSLQVCYWLRGVQGIVLPTRVAAVWRADRGKGDRRGSRNPDVFRAANNTDISLRGLEELLEPLASSPLPPRFTHAPCFGTKTARAPPVDEFPTGAHWSQGLCGGLRSPPREKMKCVHKHRCNEGKLPHATRMVASRIHSPEMNGKIKTSCNHLWNGMENQETDGTWPIGSTCRVPENTTEYRMSITCHDSRAGTKVWGKTPSCKSGEKRKQGMTCGANEIENEALKHKSRDFAGQRRHFGGECGWTSVCSTCVLPSAPCRHRVHCFRVRGRCAKLTTLLNVIVYAAVRGGRGQRGGGTAGRDEMHQRHLPPNQSHAPNLPASRGAPGWCTTDPGCGKFWVRIPAKVHSRGKYTSLRDHDISSGRNQLQGYNGELVDGGALSGSHYRSGTTTYFANSNDTSQQNGVVYQRRVIKPVHQPSVCIYLTAGSPANRDNFAGRRSQSGARLVPGASRSEWVRPRQRNHRLKAEIDRLFVFHACVQHTYPKRTQLSKLNFTVLYIPECRIRRRFSMGYCIDVKPRPFLLTGVNAGTKVREGTGDPRENLPTIAIVRHDSHLRKSRVNRPGIEPGLPWWEASSLTAQPPCSHVNSDERRKKNGTLAKCRGLSSEAETWGGFSPPCRRTCDLRSHHVGSLRARGLPRRRGHCGSTDWLLWHGEPFPHPSPHPIARHVTSRRTEQSTMRKPGEMKRCGCLGRAAEHPAELQQETGSAESLTEGVIDGKTARQFSASRNPDMLKLKFGVGRNALLTNFCDTPGEHFESDSRISLQRQDPCTPTTTRVEATRELMRMPRSTLELPRF
ncbi:hypothetical protein PR048_024398 [Dryococelus australis]|uniref:Uncharacterized protein n=1 Tax=Dryococelus australis TaxID=614101 RepID=A0ABQ9GNJ0_9NEOP|nr:hypothetical protein PR048_024398 [Dryococelus australis]